MKKITDFIVNKRYIILIAFIILAIICASISKKVNINYDINKYLPQNSPTRIGLNIMENEFKETSSFNLMFKGLKENEKQDIYNYLNGLDNIYSVDYDETEEFNKDDYTLYVITVDSDKDSEVSSNIYNTIKEKYNDSKFEVFIHCAGYNCPESIGKVKFDNLEKTSKINYLSFIKIMKYIQVEKLQIEILQYLQNG